MGCYLARRRQIWWASTRDILISSNCTTASLNLSTVCGVKIRFDTTRPIDGSSWSDVCFDSLDWAPMMDDEFSRWTCSIDLCAIASYLPIYMNGRFALT